MKRYEPTCAAECDKRRCRASGLTWAQTAVSGRVGVHVSGPNAGPGLEKSATTRTEVETPDILETFPPVAPSDDDHHVLYQVGSMVAAR
jgi:hypothetical protein